MSAWSVSMLARLPKVAQNLLQGNCQPLPLMKMLYQHRNQSGCQASLIIPSTFWSSLIRTFWNFYIVQNGRSTPIFTAISHWISPNLIKSCQILPYPTESYKISPYLTESHKMYQISLNLTKSHHISLNCTKSHHISPHTYLTKTKCQRVGLHVAMFIVDWLWLMRQKKSCTSWIWSFCYG